VVIATVTNDADNYAEEVQKTLVAHGIRADLDKSSDKISYKIRQHSLNKTPIILAVGKKEIEERKVSVRRLGSEAQEILALDVLVGKMVQEAKVPV
jgi:threonyl-tRNA synthetase